METLSWTKYTYVCDPNECDSLIEYTCSDKFGFPSGSVMNITCPCGRNPVLLSVEPATIGPLTTNERQEMEDTVTKDAVIAMWRQELELTYGNQITELQNKLSASENRIEQLQNVLSNSNSQLGKIIDNLTRDYWFSDSVDKEEVLNELCEIVDHEPKQEVRFTATITIEGRADIPLNEDVQDFLEGIEFSVDAYNGDVIIDNDSLESIEEN